MKFITTAYLTWFDDGCCDVKYLDVWAHTSRTYRPGQPLEGNWHLDEYELIIGRDGERTLFSRAADLLMRNHFYPATILHQVSDFGLGKRWPQVGDRIVQRIHVWQLGGRPLLDVLGINEVQRVTNELRRVGFTYVTVSPHVEEGEWSADLIWQDDDAVVLQIRSISRPRPTEPRRNLKFIRKMQKKAHQRGLKHFKAHVLTS